MALTDSQAAKQSATIAENAAAQAKSYAGEASKAGIYSAEAEQSAAAAAESQNSALESAHQAEVSELNAESSASSAAISAQNAVLASNVYPSEESAQEAIDGGLIPLNSVFNVVGSNDLSFVDQYINISGLATPTGKQYPTSEYINSVLPKTLSDKYVFTITDKNNKIGAGLKNDGTFIAPSMASMTSKIIDSRGNDTLYIQSSSNGINVIDNNGKISARINIDGSVDLATLSVQNLISPNLNISNSKIDSPKGYNADTVSDLASYSTLGGMSTPYGNKMANSVGIATRRLGTVVAPDSTKSFMSSQVESPCVWFDDTDLKYHMVFTGYAGTPVTPTAASACHGTSTDLVNWNIDSTALLQGSGVDGDPDKSGCTGPYIAKDASGLYFLFYIGLPIPGYEGGTKRICLATSSSLSGPWTRHGVIINVNSSAPWRNKDVYHVSIVQRNGIYYLFFNSGGASATGGSDSDGNERIGYATSTSLYGPWIVDDVNSPIINTENGTWKSKKVGDPSVWRDGSLWFMSYFGFDGVTAYDSMAVTTDDEFPLGWTEYGSPTISPTTSASDEYQFTHKPFIYHIGGKQLHYYTGVGARRAICLAVSESSIDSTFSPGNDNTIRTIIGTSRSGGGAEDRFTPEIKTLPATRVGIDYTGTYSIYRENSNGFTKNMGFNFDGKSVAIGGTTALTTAATNGFMYIPVISGTPTGTPDSKSGRVAICFDATNNKLWSYNGGWKSSTFS